MFYHYKTIPLSSADKQKQIFHVSNTNIHPITELFFELNSTFRASFESYLLLSSFDLPSIFEAGAHISENKMKSRYSIGFNNNNGSL
jgi:hypothetical protein